MPRLLLVEADPSMQDTLQNLFAAEEYYCDVAATCAEARAALGGDPFDLIILDVGRLRNEVLDLLRHIRTRHYMPVLLLAPRGDVADTVAGLEIGADDYLCEPFDPREILGRVRAQLRRADQYRRPIEQGNRIDLGEIILDVVRRDALRDGNPVKLTYREFELLYFLARHRGQALASRRIFQNVWGYDAEFGTKALAVNVGRLRRKIEADATRPMLLLSIRGFGYKLS